MANAIAKASLILGTDVSALTSGLTSAATRIKGWTASVGSTISTALSRTGFGSLGSGLGGSLAGLAGVMKTAIVAGLGFAPDFWKQQIAKIKDLSAIGLKAGGLGVMSQDYMALTQNAARFGVEADEVEKALFKVAKHGKAPLGVDPEVWAKANPAERFKELANSVKAMPNVGDQANALEMLGKSAYKMLPMFRQGGEGLAEFQKKAEQLGLAISQTDMDILMKVKSALPKLSAVFDGFQNKLTVAFAPVILEFANTFQSVMPLITGVVDQAARSIKTYMELMAFLWKEVGEGIRELIKEMPSLLEWWEKLPPVEEQIINNLQALGKAGAYVWDTLKIGIAATLAPLKVLKDAIAAIGEAVGSDKMKALANKGKFLDDWGDPVKAFRNWGKSADAVDGFFNRFRNRQKEAAKEAEKTAQTIKSSYVSVGAAIEGSKEAISILARFQTEQMMKSNEVKGGGVEKEQLAEQKKANAILQGILQKFSNGPEGMFKDNPELAII